MTEKLPTFYLSHGGGPWPYMNGEYRQRFVALEASMKQFASHLGVRPKAILVASGHWEEDDFAVMAAASPGMVYDFGGFPDYLYQIRYPAPGAPALAARVHALIHGAGLAAHLDPARGFDHGTYSLLAVPFPEADIPVLQVAIRSDYNPAAHLKLGRALAPLRDEGVLIIGSGMSYHNFHPRNARQESALFDSWLRETLIDSAPCERSERLVEWDRAPAARAAHPREDHLIPLMVAVGAAEQEQAQVIYREENFLWGATVSSYQFGGKSGVK